MLPSDKPDPARANRDGFTLLYNQKKKLWRATWPAFQKRRRRKERNNSKLACGALEWVEVLWPRIVVPSLATPSPTNGSYVLDREKQLVRDKNKRLSSDPFAETSRKAHVVEF
jgi:hypothetical protein